MLLSLWRADIDVIVPITKEDGVRVKKLGDLGYKLPKIADVGNLIQTVKY
jgi:biotin operon repressor